jgi:hypothetical protein
MDGRLKGVVAVDSLSLENLERAERLMEEQGILPDCRYIQHPDSMGRIIEMDLETLLSWARTERGD